MRWWGLFPGLGFNGILSLFGCAERRSILPYLGSPIEVKLSIKL